ncbi:MAG TPA: metallophosphoesterase [Burkholderiales bacterium]|jgi:hypothetical protein
MPDYSKHLVAVGIFYASHLVWVYFAWAFWRWRKRRQAGMLAVRCILGLLFVWARFVEPNWITERETAMPIHTGTRVALISDLHLGAYNHAGIVARVAKRINALQPDCTVIAGDFLYAPDEPLDELFATLKDIHGPLYAVLGNHDSHEVPPPHGIEVPTAEVIAALERAGVHLIENQVVDCGKVKIAGVGDLWTGKSDFHVAQAYHGPQPLVLLTHNPDLAYEVPRGLSPLLLSGHTHGGQVRLPWVYHYVIPVKGPFDYGLLSPVQWSEDPVGRPYVFTTSGIGEIALPLRLFDPPVIDLLRM